MITWFYFIVFAASLFMIAVFMSRNPMINTMYAVFSISVALNSMGRWLVAASENVGQAVWANKLMYIGACYTPLLLIILLARLCDMKIPKAITAALTVYSTAVTAAVMTIGYNGLYYKSVSLEHGAGYSYLVKEYGPLHILYPILMIIDMLFVLILIIYAIRRRDRIPSKTVASIGGLCILILGAYMLSRLLDTTIEWHSVGYLVAVIVIARRFEHMSMYDMSANIAISVERMKEYGFIAFDNRGNYINANEPAKSWFPEIRDWQTEKPVTKTDTTFFEQAVCWYMEHGGEEKAKTISIGDKFYELSVRDIIHGKKTVGGLLEVTDRTAEHGYMAKVEEARQEAIEANLAKSSFLARMSHEIRTPINAVLGMNELILRESGEENIISCASNAYNAGQALLSIISDVLDISKIEAGRMEITETEYELHSLICDCYHMTAGRAEKKDIAFSVNCDENLPSRLIGDMFHIRQTVVNFLTNAIKYTDRGSVELNVTGVLTESGITLRFEVKDTGTGIKPENLDRLFTSFQRFDLERNQSVEGTGLGLSICKQLAELMGGTVGVQSVYGEGSVFSCEIPQRIADNTPAGKIDLGSAARKLTEEERETFTAPAARILAVDDVEMNLLVFTGFLKEHNVTVDTALSGKDCLELAAKNRYDIIFMDHMMPVMDGLETFAQLKEKKLITEETPVVMLTANAVAGMEEKYLSMGFASYLTKPVRSASLRKMLLKYLPEEKIIHGEKTAPMAETSFGDMTGNGLIDMKVGMEYSSGNREIYFSALEMFVNSGREKLEKIKQLAGGDSLKDYATEVHALKSTALTVGAKELSGLAKELEAAGKSGNISLIKEKNGQFLELYEKVLSAGGEILAKERPKEEKPSAALEDISSEKLGGLIDSIKAACENFDGDAVAAICGEAASYSFGGVPLDGLFEPVRKYAAEFEYDRAAEAAEEVRKKI